MTVQITFPYNGVLDSLHGQLALIGKRASTKDGETLWGDITFSDAERDALRPHVRQGVTNVVSTVLDKVQGFSSDDVEAKFRVTNTRMDSLDNDTFSSIFSNLMKDYVLYYALYVWMCMTRPEQVSILREERDRRLLAIRDFVYHKGEFLSEGDYAGVTGEVVDDD